MDKDFDSARGAAHACAVGRFDSDRQRHAAPSDRVRTTAGEIGDAEAGNVRVRLVPIENILVAALASASDAQLDLIREMAAYISPRDGKTPHRLTVEAAHNMLAIIERADHYHRLESDRK